MAIDPVGYLPASREISLAPAALPSAAQAAGASANAGFDQWLTGAVQQVDAQLVAADEGMRRLASGEAASLHQVMIALEQARLGVQLVAQVRNRLLDAYQEVLRMPL